ncbi:MAG: metallopeptidase [Lachnospiraceae bacterium]|nr:metallopeptidase [Lachnospiraceae bacterium]
MNEKIHTREALQQLGSRILGDVRTGLYLAMHFLGAALFGLDFVMDLNTRTIGTDGAFIRYNTRYLREQYLESENGLERAYMHMLLHCLFLHMFHKKAYPDGDLWDVCCDIAVEAAIDDMDVPLLNRVTSDFREEWYDRLQGAVSYITAEKLYRYFTDNPTDGITMHRIAAEFAVDDHGFWEKLKDEQNKEAPELPEDIRMTPMANLPLKETWERAAERVAVEMDISGSERGDERGRLSRILKTYYEPHPDYTAFLLQFAVYREELSIDMEMFDPGYYHYGIKLYGNLPLIEPVEYRESRRIDELVIAIDTSASTNRHHVQKFLNQTMELLQTQGSFFSRFHIRLIECDDAVQHEIIIENMRDLKKYNDNFTVKGGYGTDFRPVFAHIGDLRKRGELTHLRGLIYFTDGHGIYPKEATAYQTAFVFLKDEEYDDREVPGWALKLYV